MALCCNNTLCSIATFSSSVTPFKYVYVPCWGTLFNAPNFCDSIAVNTNNKIEA